MLCAILRNTWPKSFVLVTPTRKSIRFYRGKILILGNKRKQKDDTCVAFYRIGGWQLLGLSMCKYLKHSTLRENPHCNTFKRFYKQIFLPFAFIRYICDSLKERSK